ncbi:MAG: geranylgeranyl reductase family protein [Candidatus Hodarchaeales archaeon]|jgi:geranylgeranyl reductase family protein
MALRAQNDFDIAIIGAGPSGSLAGRQAAIENPESSIVIFEEHNQIGKPTHCSGLIALQGLHNLGIKDSIIQKKLLVNEIKRARFYAPNNNSFQITRKNDSLVVLDRYILDRYLASSSERVGAKIYSDHQVREIIFARNSWKLLIRHRKKLKKINAEFLISAEGSKARLAQSIGLKTPNQNWLFPAIQYEMERLTDFETDCSELFFGNKYAPGFFGWFIPLNEESARLGIAISPIYAGKTRIYMERFLRKHPIIKMRTKKAKRINSYGGFVPASGPVKKTFSKHFMLVGDAAGQTKATTGGGVNIGGFCGRLAGKYAGKIIANEISSQQGCQEYQNQYKAHFEPNLSLMKYFRRIISNLPDKVWDDLIEIALTTDMEESLRSTDIDLHGSGLLQYVLQPKVLAKGLKLTPQMILGMIKGFLL